MPRKLSVSEVVRQAIEKSGKSYLKIAHDTGIDDSQLSRFMADDPKKRRGLNTATLDRLCEYLGLQLVGRNRR